MKKTNLALSLDYDCFEKILNTLRVVGEHIIIVKLHVDIIRNFKLEYISELMEMSKKLQFFIFEDRKFSEIGSIFQKQYQGGIYNISNWSNLINFHLISGDSNVKVYQDICQKETQGGLLVAQMSNLNNFITEDYTRKVVKVAQDNNSICGFISQEKKSGDNFLYLTPGVSMKEGNDHLDQKYRTPYDVIVKRGCDIIIVGRGITGSETVLKNTILYKDTAWSSYLLSLQGR